MNVKNNMREKFPEKLLNLIARSEYQVHFLLSVIKRTQNIHHIFPIKTKFITGATHIHTYTVKGLYNYGFQSNTQTNL